MFKRLESNTSRMITVVINGKEVLVPPEETVAAAVLAHGLSFIRTTPVSGAPRSPYCMMGVCFECLMVIDGVPNQRACQQRVRDGMTIESQQGAGNTL